MTDIETLEDIIHQEEMAKIKKEIEELPDLNGEVNSIINDECINLSSPDLLIGNPLFKKPMNKTDWRDRYIKDGLELKALHRKKGDLQDIVYLYYIAGFIQLSFTFALFWLMASTGN